MGLKGGVRNPLGFDGLLGLLKLLEKRREELLRRLRGLLLLLRERVGVAELAAREHLELLRGDLPRPYEFRQRGNIELSLRLVLLRRQELLLLLLLRVVLPLHLLDEVLEMPGVGLPGDERESSSRSIAAVGEVLSLGWG